MHHAVISFITQDSATLSYVAKYGCSHILSKIKLWLQCIACTLRFDQTRYTVTGLHFTALHWGTGALLRCAALPYKGWSQRHIL